MSLMGRLVEVDDFKTGHSDRAQLSERNLLRPRNACLGQLPPLKNDCKQLLDHNIRLPHQLPKALRVVLDLLGHLVRRIADRLGTDFFHALAEVR